jgi:hypothetical protein
MIDPAAESAFVENLGPELAGTTYDFGGAEANRAALTSVRSAGNETVLPDSLLKTFKPTFLIRHPALAFPSLLRVGIKAFGVADGNNWQQTFRWTKSVYEWYCTHLSDAEKQTALKGVQFPIIIDADDINSPELVQEYAKAVGMDNTLLRRTWTTATPQELAEQPKTAAYFVETLNQSQGIVQSKSGASIDLVVEKEKWIQEFGQDLGGQLGMLVDRAMPEYEWLKERRLRV